MADSDVNIVGLDGVAPPLWATEQTLQDMLEKIETLVSISTQQKRDLKGVITGAGKAGTGKTDPKKLDNLFSSLSSGLKDSAKGAADSAAGFDNLPGPLSKFGKAIKKTTGATKLAAIGIGIIANQAGKAIATIKESVNTLRDLSDSGIRLHGGFMEVQKGLAQTGMTIGEFGEMTSKYAQVINRQGFKAISNLAQAVDNAESGFEKWGLTTVEGTEIAAELIDQQRRAGVFEQINEQRQKTLITDVMDRLTKYSKVLNVSREAMMQSRKAILDDSQVRFRMSQMDAKEREKVRKGLSSMSDATTGLGEDFAWVQQLLKETAVEGINVQSEQWQALAGAGFIEVANDLGRLGDALGEGEETTLEEIALKLRAATSSKEFMEAMFMAKGASREWAEKLGAASLSAEEALSQLKRNRESGDETFQTSVDHNVQQLTRLQDSIAQWQATAEYLRTTIFMELIGGTGKNAIELAIKGIDAMRDKMFEFAESGATAKFREWVIENPVAAGGALVAAFVALKVSTLAVSASVAKMGPGLLKFGRGLGAAGAVMAAGAAGYAVGTGINNYLGRIWGDDRQLSTMLLDSTSSFNNYDPNATTLSPEAKRMADQARERRAERAAKAQAATPATTTSSSQPATPAEPTMSAVDVAKLSQAEQTNHYLSELLRVNKKTGRAIAGEL